MDASKIFYGDGILGLPWARCRSCKNKYDKNSINFIFGNPMQPFECDNCRITQAVENPKSFSPPKSTDQFASGPSTLGPINLKANLNWPQKSAAEKQLSELRIACNNIAAQTRSNRDQIRFLSHQFHQMEMCLFKMKEEIVNYEQKMDTCMIQMQDTILKLEHRMHSIVPRKMAYAQPEPKPEQSCVCAYHRDDFDLIRCRQWLSANKYGRQLDNNPKARI